MSNASNSNDIQTYGKLNPKKFLKTNKLPILVTVIFFLLTSYVSFFIDDPARGSDAMFYFFAGEQILFGDNENVRVPNAPIGGPVLFSSLNTVFNDKQHFLLMKYFQFF